MAELQATRGGDDMAPLPFVDSLTARIPRYLVEFGGACLKLPLGTVSFGIIAPIDCLFSQNIQMWTVLRRCWGCRAAFPLKTTKI